MESVRSNLYVLLNVNVPGSFAVQVLPLQVILLEPFASVIETSPEIVAAVVVTVGLARKTLAQTVLESSPELFVFDE